MGELTPIGSALTQGSESVLDLASLIAPIPGDNPAGTDLRIDTSPHSIYQKLRERRTAARNNERSALANGDSDYISRPDWAEIIAVAPQILREHSKDLEVAAWLIEALTRTYGFNGVTAGFTLARLLIEQYGPALYPPLDEDGIAGQLAALTGLNGFGSEGALIAPLKSIPLTEGAPPAPFSAWQCEQAFATDRIGDESRRAARSKRGFVTSADIDRAMAETSPAFVTTVHQELCHTIEAFEHYQTAIDAYCQAAPQPTARIKETLESILHTLRHIAGDKIITPEPVVTDDEPASPAEGEVALASPAAKAQALLDREAALKQLKGIAVFFRRTEPHSPISYALEQAVYWSQLSLPELIGELIPDEGARLKFQKLTGIRATD
jgi:type VI secretion system protein ImpA